MICPGTPASSATSSAGDLRDNLIPRRSATAAARAKLLDTPQPCPITAQHEQAVELTMHEVVGCDARINV